MNATTGFTNALTKLVNKEQYHGEGAEGYQKQTPIQINHHHNGSNEDYTFGYHFHYVFNHGRLQSVNVIGYIAHNGASFILIVKI